MVVEAPPARQAELLQALHRQDQALWTQVRSLIRVHSQAADLAQRWNLPGPLPGAPWEAVRALARQLLHSSPVTRAQYIDACPPPLRDALLSTLVVFQGAPGELQEAPEQRQETLGGRGGSAVGPHRDGAPPSSVSGPLRAGTQVHQYEVLGVLGEGGMGIVYRARDARLGRTVALKVLSPHLRADAEAQARFEHEARAASALDHPNVGYIHEISATEGGQPFIAMAHYAGETLQEKLSRGPLPIDEALVYARQIAEGLAAAHAAGIVHRDIKPANVVVTTGGVAKILDFGLAKMQDVTLTRTAARMGTVAYMSPEQARGGAVDARTDLWALGALLYELVAGMRPFEGAYETAVLYNVVNEAPTPLRAHRPDCPEAVEALVDRCLQKAPADRPADAQDFLDDLDRITGDTGDGSIRRAGRGAGRPAAGSAPGVWRALRSRAGRLASAGLGIVALAALLWVAGGQVFTGNAAVQPRHLAVLPFQVIGERAERDGTTGSDVYAAGLLETLTSKLTQLEQFQGALWVVPASEVSAAMTPSDARERFGVTMVVSGSIQLADEQVRLTLNLIDAETRRQIGSEQIDHRSAGALALQDEAVLMLARMLQVELRPEQQAALTAGGTTAPAANDFYLRGRGYLRNQESAADLDVAIALFEKAIARDSLFALAWAGLGEAYWLKYRATEDVQWTEAALQASRQALALNEGTAPVHVTLGMIQADRQRYAEAHAAFQRALEIDPFNAEAYRRRARVYRSQGAFEQAEAAYKKAIDLKPSYWRGYSSLGALYYMTGRYTDALEQFAYGLELAPANKTLLTNQGAAAWQLGRLQNATDAFERILRVDPDHASAQANLATAYFYQGAYAEAAALYEAQQARTPHVSYVQGFLADAYYWMPEPAKAEAAYRKAIALTEEQVAVRGSEPDLIGSLASYHARLGERAQALRYLRQIQATMTPQEADVVLAFGMGEVYEQLGQREAALPWMARALERGYGWIKVRHSPWLDGFREDPAVQSWLAGISGDDP